MSGIESLAESSARLLRELQADAFSQRPRIAVLVEGLSDYFAVQAAGRLLGMDLAADGRAVVPMGGATNLKHFIERFRSQDANIGLSGLCDLGEEPFFARTLGAAGVTAGTKRSDLEAAGFFVLDRDLEDELIRALGCAAVEEIIEREGDLESLRRLQQMPAHRDRTVEEHLHRFMGVRSGRKYHYAPLLVTALDAERIPLPMQSLLATTL